jgi:hypothetical protein
MSRRRRILLSAASLLIVPGSMALAQDGLQLNVPYLCPDGSTYVVHSCTVVRNGESCSYQRDQNSERYNHRVDVANQMRTCKVRGTSAAGQAAPGSGDYTNDLPSVQRVESAIRGKDATDTMQRQIAALQALAQYIDTVKYARTVRGPYTPSEAKLMAAYRGAAAQISQDYAKSHTPAEAAEFNRLAAKYIFDKGLYDDYHRLMGSQAASANASAKASLDATANRERERTQQMMNPTQSRGSAVANSSGARTDDFFAREQAKLESDPRVRRCLELGGGVDQCEGTDVTGMAETAQSFVSKLVGVDPNAGLPTSGVLLVGQYHSRSELPEITLTAGGEAVLQHCGTLVDENHTYTLRRSGTMTQVVIANEPAPIVLTLDPGGSLAGPGNTTVKGRIITGYTTTTSQVMVNGAPAAAQGYYCNGPCTKSTSTPVYAPSMQRCTLSQLAPQAAPPPKADPNAALAKMFGMSTRTPVATTYGLRLVGTYASSNGMKLAFSNRYVTIDCGNAHVNAPYGVENTPSGFIVRVQNAGGAFALSVAPGNTLRGSGSTTVNGKLVSSFHDDNVSFTPHLESCPVRVFTPEAAKPR